jgi:OOP family OmpA-OmpF porin
MMFYLRNVILCVVMLFTFTAVLPAQTAKESIFGDVEKLINEAKENDAELLSPEFFSKALENFRRANEMYVNNKSTRDIREALTEAQRYCNRALQAVKLAKISLKEPIEARQDALRVEANTYAKEIFEEAERKFADATAQVEDDDLEDARDKGSEAEAMYRQAELKSIKVKILGDARKLVQKAEDGDVEEYAPQTFARAKTLLAEVENLLTYDRYASEEAGGKALESIYQARHSMYLAKQVKALSEDDKNWEKLLLQFEDVLTGIAANFDETPQFDNGLQEAIDLITTRINKLKQENQQLISENAALQEENEALKETATASTAELAKKKEREEKFEKIKSLFTPNEAKVVFDGDNLVIRLQGLNFAPGQAVIQPEYFSLLTKVQEALKIFPDKHILLEGHTDSRGVPKINKKLSEDRAIAVREYLIANMGKPREQITALGYGSAKPVASNETPEGRALNRRIDIVISMND